MSSILTNNSAMTALSTLRGINKGLNQTQDRISTGLKVGSAKDNASYFSISTKMTSESGMNKAVNEGLTLAKNSVATARLGAETVMDLAQQFVDRVAFAQGEGVNKADVQKELDSLAAQMKSAVDQSSFNGENLIKGAGVVYDPTDRYGGGAVLEAGVTGSKSFTSGVSRAADGSIATTTISLNTMDFDALASAFANIDVTTSADLAVNGGDADGTTTEAEYLAKMATDLKEAEALLSLATKGATDLGISERAIETQQDFLGELTNRLDAGVGSMIDADMEEEAARLQALQVQQQLASQSLSIANQAPQNILSLFR